MWSQFPDYYALTQDHNNEFTQNPCNTGYRIESQSVVFTEDGLASVEIVFDQSLNGLPVADIQITDDQGNSYIAYYTGYNVYRLDQIPQGVRLTIRASSEEGCPELPISGIQDVECTGAEGTTLRPEFAALVFSYLALAPDERPPLYEYINEYPGDLTTMERWMIYQASRMSCDPVEEDLLDSSIPPLYSGNLDRLCNCVQLNVPVRARAVGSDANNTWTPVFASNYDDRGSNPQQWYNRVDQGPARYNQVYSTAWKSPYGRMFINRYGEQGGIRNQEAHIDVVLLCTNEEEYPEECGCSRDATFTWSYNSNISMAANLLGSNNTRRAGAYVEDFVFVGEEDQAGNFALFDEDAFRLSAECSLSLNLASLATTIGTVTSDLISVVGTVSGGAPPSSTSVTSAITGLGTLFTTPVWTQMGECYTGPPTPGIRTSGSAPVTFEVNVPKRLFIATSETLRAQGMRKYYAHAGVVSDFNISLYIPDNTENNPDFCCSPNVFAYGLGSIAGAPFSESNHQSEVEDQLNSLLFGLNATVDDNFNTHHTPSDEEHCNDVIVLPLTISDEDVYAVELYDMLGRVVSRDESQDFLDTNQKDGTYTLVKLGADGSPISSTRVIISNQRIIAEETIKK